MCSHSECTNCRQMRKSLDSTTNHLQGSYMVFPLAWHLVNMWGWHAPLSPTVSKQACQCAAGVSGAGATAESATSWNGGASLSFPHRHREGTPDGGMEPVAGSFSWTSWALRDTLLTYIVFFVHMRVVLYLCALTSTYISCVGNGPAISNEVPPSWER